MRYSMLCVMAALLCFGAQGLTAAQDKKNHPRLDAVLRVKVDAKLLVSCQFDLLGKMDQSFMNTEYRRATALRTRAGIGC